MEELLLTVREISELYDNKISQEWIRHVFYRSEFATYRLDYRPLQIKWNYETKKMFNEAVKKSHGLHHGSYN